MAKKKGLLRRLLRPKKTKKKKTVVKKGKKRASRVKKEPKESISRNECPECGSVNIVISQITGNMICQDCGAILAGLTPEVEEKFVEVKKQF